MYLIVIIAFGLTFISSQDAAVQTECAKVGTNAKSYDDCKNYDNETASTLCCFVQGTSNNSDETSCLDVDILFKDKVIEYNSEGVSGKLICKADGGNASAFIHIKIASIFLFAVFIL